jgi:hypothetical protein
MTEPLRMQIEQLQRTPAVIGSQVSSNWNALQWQRP